MNQTEQALRFWNQINKHFEHEQITRWIVTLESGKGDWFRNYSLVKIALSPHCRIGRIGFDQKKFDKLNKWADGVLVQCGLNPSWMQN